MAEHLDGFPERRKELLDFQKKTNTNFDEVKRLIEVSRTHMSPSPVTLSKISEVEQKIEQGKLLNSQWTVSNDKKMERIERVLFGDPFDNKDLGLNQMVKDIHNKLAGETGFWDRVFFIAKVAGATTAIGFLVAGSIAFLKK